MVNIGTQFTFECLLKKNSLNFETSLAPFLSFTSDDVIDCNLSKLLSG